MLCEPKNAARCGMYCLILSVRVFVCLPFVCLSVYLSLSVYLCLSLPVSARSSKPWHPSECAKDPQTLGLSRGPPHPQADAMLWHDTLHPQDAPAAKTDRVLAQHSPGTTKTTMHSLGTCQRLPARISQHKRNCQLIQLRARLCLPFSVYAVALDEAVNCKDRYRRPRRGFRTPGRHRARATAPRSGSKLLRPVRAVDDQGAGHATSRALHTPHIRKSLGKRLARPWLAKDVKVSSSSAFEAAQEALADRAARGEAM